MRQITCRLCRQRRAEHLEGLCKFCFDLRLTVLSNIDLTYRILEEVKLLVEEKGEENDRVSDSQA